jgi:hypothetical protein
MERGNYAYFIYTDTIPAKQIMRALPRGAQLQFSNGKKLETNLKHNTWPDSNKMVFWYRHNKTVQKAEFKLLHFGQQVSNIKFWPNADLVFVDLDAVKGEGFSVEILVDDRVVEQKDLPLEQK